jgi:hypothetical protein
MESQMPDDRAFVVSKLAIDALTSNNVGVTEHGHFEVIDDDLYAKMLGVIPRRPEIMDAIIRASAQKVITEKWEALNAADGPLGVPIAPLRFDGGFTQVYRGGQIELRDGELQAVQQHRLRVRYAGMHCFGAQSGPGDDDIYAFVNVYAPEQARRKPEAIKIPDGSGTIAMDSRRSSAEGFGEIWSGPPQDLAISAVLWEQDTGFPAEKKRYVDAGLAAGAAAVGGLIGGPAGAALGGGLAAAFVPEFTSFVASEILGVDDDCIDTDVRTVLYQEQMGLLPVQNQWDLQFTHETKLLTDGDASYKLFFQVIREDIATTL